MSNDLKPRIINVLWGIYSMHHSCGLAKEERGLEKGRLCDNCMAEIAAWFKELFGQGLTINQVEKIKSKDEFVRILCKGL